MTSPDSSHWIPPQTAKHASLPTNSRSPPCRVSAVLLVSPSCSRLGFSASSSRHAPRSFPPGPPRPPSVCTSEPRHSNQVPSYLLRTTLLQTTGILFPRVPSHLAVALLTSSLPRASTPFAEQLEPQTRSALSAHPCPRYPTVQTETDPRLPALRETDRRNVPFPQSRHLVILRNPVSNRSLPKKPRCRSGERRRISTPHSATSTSRKMPSQYVYPLYPLPALSKTLDLTVFLCSGIGGSQRSHHRG